jgi:hypothetical protein
VKSRPGGSFYYTSSELHKNDAEEILFLLTRAAIHTMMALLWGAASSQPNVRQR